MEGLNITELEYRELENISYSLLSSIDRDKHYALKKVFVPSIPTIYGILTESILFGDYDKNDYYIFKGDIPTDKLGTACNIIFPKLDISNEKLIDNKDVIISILTALEIDYFAKREPEWIADKLIKDSSEYWSEWRLSVGKIRITEDLLKTAEQASKTLKSHQFTRGIFNSNSFFNVTKQSQVKLTFKFLGKDFKAMLDWLIIDHDNKVIKPYDLKTGGKTVEEFENSFFYWRYDIQALLYTTAITTLRNEKYPGYTIDPFRFVYISRLNEYRPLVWTTTKKMMKGTLKGFTMNNVPYKGVIELIDDYKWYSSNRNVSYPREVYEASGEIIINDNIIINEN
tara:strand:+ start:10406 stop:11428 length:1023 start_codon:yes stop_codon:yes gene_type:complete